MSTIYTKIVKFLTGWEPCEVPKWFHSQDSASPYPMIPVFTEYVKGRTFQYKIVSSGGFFAQGRRMGGTVRAYRKLIKK